MKNFINILIVFTAKSLVWGCFSNLVSVVRNALGVGRIARNGELWSCRDDRHAIYPGDACYDKYGEGNAFNDGPRTQEEEGAIYAVHEPSIAKPAVEQARSEGHCDRVGDYAAK